VVHKSKTEIVTRLGLNQLRTKTTCSVPRALGGHSLRGTGSFEGDFGSRASPRISRHVESRLVRIRPKSTRSVILMTDPSFPCRDTQRKNALDPGRLIHIPGAPHPLSTLDFPVLKRKVKETSRHVSTADGPNFLIFEIRSIRHGIALVMIYV